MNRYLIAAVATIGIALSAGTASACQKLNSASTQSDSAPQTQQSSPAATNEKAG